jgi:dipeptide/tripeptide permease
LKRRKTESKDHWLDYAQEKYGVSLVEDTKSSLNVLVMMLPIPMFWTLHMQQGSRFVFQAIRMEGDLGFYTIKPDQMIIFNSLFSIILVPVYERIFYPILAKVGVTTPLRKITIGLFLAAAGFVTAALVEIRILYLVPQYAILVMAEIMIYIPCLNFAYKEAPANMKSVMVAFFYLTMAVGNLFMVFISGSRIFESQVHEFLFFAGLMVIDTFIFIFLAVRYKYVQRAEESITK